MHNRIVFNLYESSTRLVITPSRQCPLKALRKLMDHEKMLLWYKRKPKTAKKSGTAKKTTTQGKATATKKTTTRKPVKK